MSVTSDIIEYLEASNLIHKVYMHEHSASSQESADARKNAGAGNTTGAKALLLKNKQGDFAICVMPGTSKLNSKAVRKCFGKFKFASPEEMHEIARGLLPGTLPPFGYSIFPKLNFFMIDESLEKEPALGFNAGCHRTSIVLSGSDYFNIAKLDNPITGDFSV